MLCHCVQREDIFNANFASKEEAGVGAAGFEKVGAPFGICKTNTKY